MPEPPNPNRPRLRPRWAMILPALLLAVPWPARPALPAAESSRDDAVLLEESFELEILSPRQAVLRYANRTQVLTPAGVEAFDTARIPINPSRLVRSMSAAVVSPAGRRVEVKKQSFSESAVFGEYEMYSDSRSRNIHFPGVVPGSILEYRYEQEFRTLFWLPPYIALQNSVPSRSLQVIIRYPGAFPLRAVPENGAPDAVREERDGSVTLRWTAQNVPEFRLQPRMPPELDVLPRIVLYPGEIEWEDQRIDSRTWEGIAKWYWSLARDRMVPAPAVAEQSRQLSGEGNASVRRQRLFEFVQRTVHYVAVELGIGGFQPHPGEQVLRFRYGDCKDKATLLIGLLRAAGLEGYPVLIRTRFAGRLDRDIPSTHFNHVIVAVPEGSGYLFLDPTAENTPYGDLPEMDQGVPVLVVREEGRGELIETPLFPPQRNRQQRIIHATLTAAGTLSGTFAVQASGAGGSSLLALLGTGKSMDSGDMMAALMRWLCPGAVIGRHEATPPARPGDPYQVKLDFQVPRFSTRAGTLELFSPHVARFDFMSEIPPGASRRYPVFFDALTLEEIETRIVLPPGKTIKQLPPPRDAEGPGVKASSRYELAREGDLEVLVVRRFLEVGRREIPASDFPALAVFLAGLAREEASAVTLVPAA